jgi:DNA-binding NarL/FixJ family response regulator
VTVPTARSLRILVVDDHPLARHGLRVLVAGQHPDASLLDAANSAQALELAANRAPDIVLLDLHMPDSESPSILCAKLLEAAPRAAIVLVTAFDELDEIKACLAMGARGCLLKDINEEGLAAAMRRALAGERVIDPRIGQRLAAEYIEALASDRPAIQLTRRERAVLLLLAEGASNRAIAANLHLAENTVKGYIAQLMEKLGASSRLQIVVYADRRGLL